MWSISSTLFDYTVPAIVTDTFWIVVLWVLLFPLRRSFLLLFHGYFAFTTYFVPFIPVGIKSIRGRPRLDTLNRALTFPTAR